jgi:biotin carboxyl carrier protein
MSRRRYFVGVGSREMTVDVERLPDGTFRAHVAGEEKPRELAVLREGPKAALLAGGQVLEVFGSAAHGQKLTTGPARQRIAVAERSRGATRAGATGAVEAAIRAPMPGRVLKVLVAPGDTIALGAGVAIVEAMKMENELSAPRAGTVKRVLVGVGDTVERDAVLVELE